MAFLKSASIHQMEENCGKSKRMLSEASFSKTTLQEHCKILQLLELVIVPRVLLDMIWCGKICVLHIPVDRVAKVFFPKSFPPSIYAREKLSG